MTSGTPRHRAVRAGPTIAVLIACGTLVTSCAPVPGAPDRSPAAGGPTALASSDPRVQSAWKTPFHSGRWSVAVVAFDAKADEAVAAANPFPVDPPPGTQWALATVAVTNTSPDEADAGPVSFSLAIDSQSFTSDAVAALTLSPLIPHALDRYDIQPGETRTGNVAFVMPTADASTCLIRVEIRTTHSSSTMSWACAQETP